jgi:MYXO-CTERM domain-containing protein
MSFLMNKNLGLLVGATTGLVLLSATAEAQSLRPNVLVLFDTSGSMLNGGKDGSPLCTGGGTASRIYNMKNALRQAMAQVGTDEANFGLMRFPQVENASQPFSCPAGHWSLTGTNSSCHMSSDPNTSNNTTNAEPAYGGWFDTGISQSLLVPLTLPASGLKPGAASDYDPSDGNISEVYRWIDLTDAGQTGPGNTDPELRAPSSSNTPLGRSLFYAREYFENYVFPKDPKKSCRSNLIILATDGADTCDNTAGSALNLSTCAYTGYATFNPQVQACKLNHSTVIPKGVQTYILTDSGLTTAEKTTANAIAAAGGTGSAVFVTLTDTAAVKQAFVDIIAKTVPPPEVCNGVDDNCNGLIDEGVSNNYWATHPGSNQNNPADPDNQPGALLHCAVEICDCKDNDFDGQVDEGFPPNACGGPSCCSVPTEVCNGKDDNCDGQVDEGFNIGGPCPAPNPAKGACFRNGVWACASDGTRFCDVPTVAPTPEVCNGIDDDCNGTPDDGMLPGVGETCGNGLGACSSGTFICQAGKLTCNATATPKTEVCNGIDDDCNGIIDDGNFPTVGQSCICPGLDPAKVGVGVCKAGQIACKGALGLICDGCIFPSAEICDGKDNDCDGVIDTSAMCPSGFGCSGGQCALACRTGEFPCPSGYKCVSDYCIPQRCAGVTCPSDKRCDESTGQCVDLCANVVCPTTAVCMQGRCLDCNTLGCDPGQICIASVCQVDTCAGVTCGNGTYCSNGQCVDLCTPGKCGSGTRCVAGACIPDKCSQVVCDPGKYCDPGTGTCKIDVCDAMQCGAGERCVSTSGQCAPDPCLLIQCPGDCWTCGTTADGTGTCLLDASCKEKISQVGQRGGGTAALGCAVGGDAPSGTATGLVLAALALGGLWVARRRAPARVKAARRRR